MKATERARLRELAEILKFRRPWDERDLSEMAEFIDSVLPLLEQMERMEKALRPFATLGELLRSRGVSDDATVSLGTWEDTTHHIADQLFELPEFRAHIRMAAKDFYDIEAALRGEEPAK